jgi:hypothetical protein
MVKQVGKVSLEVEKTATINGKEALLKYEFVMPMGAPFGVSYDSAHEILEEIVKMAQDASKRAARDKEEVKEEN